eukprot:scaffold14751_cov63-Skeletonema_dohrnii-CCMP3373.AAC.1
MWSQFAVRKDVVAGAEEASAAQQAPGEGEQINISEDNNGWNDDSFDMEDEEFDTIIDDDGEGPSTLAAATAADANDNAIITSTADGWDDSLLDELNSPSRSSSAVQQEENIEDNTASNLQANTTIDATTAGGGTLGKAAENFGAALLASLDDDDDEEDDQQQQQTSGRGGGFGAGFVMKGLSRFIEAATIPQEEYEEEEDMNYDEDGGGGWDDDDNLEMDDDDDFDFSQNNDDGDHLEQTRVDEEVDNDEIPQEDLEKSDSIPIVQNLVEEEEEEILAQEDGWDDIDVDDSMFEQEVEESNDERLNSGDDHTNQMIVDDYEIDKDKSPEPVVKHDDAEERSSSLPHQQS